jgi:hypothetical protein
MALLILFGQVGYPEYVLEANLRSMAMGRPPFNRVPYEIPDRLVVSLYPQSVEDSLPVVLLLRELGLLFTYTEEEISSDVPRFGLGDELPVEWLSQSLADHLDTRDRLLSQVMDFDIDLEGYESIIATLTTTASHHNGYPALLLPEASQRWLQSRGSPLHVAAHVEMELLARLPDHLLGFQHLTELLEHPAVPTLRQAVQEQAGHASPASVEAAMEDVLEEIEERGLPYRDAILNRGDFSYLSATMGDFPNASPADAALDFLDDLPPLTAHIASTAIAGQNARVRLMLVPGPELWVPPVNDMSMVQIYSSMELGKPRRSAYLYEPF